MRTLCTAQKKLLDRAASSGVRSVADAPGLLTALEIIRDFETLYQEADRYLWDAKFRQARTPGYMTA